jgi:hypothetical protein
MGPNGVEGRWTAARRAKYRSSRCADDSASEDEQQKSGHRERKQEGQAAPKAVTEEKEHRSTLSGSAWNTNAAPGKPRGGVR